MKASLFSGILLLLVIVSVIFNAIYVQYVSDSLKNMLSRLPCEPSETAANMADVIFSYLKKHETFLSFSVPYQTLDRCMELAVSLRVYATIRSPIEYKVTKTLLMDVLQDVERLEQLKLKNIF